MLYAILTAFNFNLFLEEQNVTIAMFAPLMFFLPAVALMVPLQKFPLFWSWSTSDPHVQCLFRCGSQDPLAKLVFEIGTNGPIILLFLATWKQVGWGILRPRKKEIVVE